jgi:hypothetical protein
MVKNTLGLWCRAVHCCPALAEPFWWYKWNNLIEWMATVVGSPWQYLLVH